MKITPYTEGCGALVNDVQLANIDDDQTQKIKQALYRYGVLFFREQELSEPQHIELASRLGEIVLNKFFEPVTDYPQIATVSKEPHQTMNVGGGWHTDHSYEANPALGSILVARELPSTGGDTEFAHLGRVCERLSDEFKNLLRGLRAIHSNEHIYGDNGYYSQTDQSSLAKGAEVVGQAVHPMIIRHPQTGQEVLYVNPGHTIGIEGMTHGESFAILHYLYELATGPQFTCRFDWQPGSVAIWDNRITWHQAHNDYQGERRLMHRITLAGDLLSDELTTA